MTDNAAREQAAFVVRLPVDHHQRLRELAQQEDRSMASVVRLAIRRYLHEIDDHPDHQEAAV